MTWLMQTLILGSSLILISGHAQNNTSKPKQWEIVTKTCSLEKSFITPQGLLVCDYTCGGADKQHVYKTYFYNNALCPKTIEEKLKVAK